MSEYARVRDLKELRLALGLRQVDAARAADVHQSTISRLERNVITTAPERLQKILAAIELFPVDGDTELSADVARPLDELKKDATSINSLLTAIVRELRAGGDRELLAELAALAIDRAERIRVAVNTRIASLPGKAN